LGGGVKWSVQYGTNKTVHYRISYED
jgi:hypothetical protein